MHDKMVSYTRIWHSDGIKPRKNQVAIITMSNNIYKKDNDEISDLSGNSDHDDHSDHSGDVEEEVGHPVTWK